MKLSFILHKLTVIGKGIQSIKTNRTILIVALLTCFIPFAFLFSPAPRSSDPICGLYIKINDAMGFPFNCDSGGLVNLAKDPKSIFDEGNLLQSRPGIIPVGIIFSLPFTILSKIIHLPQYLRGTYVDFNYFMGFVLLNFFLLFCSLVMFLKIAKDLLFNKFLTIAGAFLLASNLVIKPFMFTPHQQLFNIFIPICSIFIIHMGMRRGLNNKVIYTISLLIGFGLLFYPSIELILAAIAIVYILTRINLRKFKVTQVVPLSVCIFLSAIPSVLWPIIVKSRIGSYFNNGAQAYNQFVWVIQGFQGGFSNGINVLVSHINSFYASCSTEIKISFVVLIILLVAIRLIYKEAVERRKVYKEILPYILMLLVIVVFFFLLGTYFERLIFNILLMVEFVVILLMNKYLKLDKRLQLIPIILVVFEIYKFIVLLQQHGPYSP